MYSQTNSYTLKLVRINQVHPFISGYCHTVREGWGLTFHSQIVGAFFIIFLLILINSHQQKLGTQDK